jgi:DNA-binding transcriptional MerR regulator
MSRPLTVGGLARASEASEASIRTYARENLIEFTTDSSGRRLFDPSVVQVVRELRKRRIASRGRRSAP